MAPGTASAESKKSHDEDMSDFDEWCNDDLAASASGCAGLSYGSSLDSIVFGGGNLTTDGDHATSTTGTCAHPPEKSRRPENPFRCGGRYNEDTEGRTIALESIERGSRSYSSCDSAVSASRGETLRAKEFFLAACGIPC